MPSAAKAYLEATPLKTILNIPTEVLDHVMATAYQLYQRGCYPQAEVMCRGLLAADHRYWWSHSLYAATLHKMGRHAEALKQVDLGLHYEPRQAKLVALREEILKNAKPARGTAGAKRNAGISTPMREVA